MSSLNLNSEKSELAQSTNVAFRNSPSFAGSWLDKIPGDFE